MEEIDLQRFPSRRLDARAGEGKQQAQPVQPSRITTGLPVAQIAN